MWSDYLIRLYLLRSQFCRKWQNDLIRLKLLHKSAVTGEMYVTGRQRKQLEESLPCAILSTPISFPARSRLFRPMMKFRPRRTYWHQEKRALLHRVSPSGSKRSDSKVPGCRSNSNGRHTSLDSQTFHSWRQQSFSPWVLSTTRHGLPDISEKSWSWEIGSSNVPWRQHFAQQQTLW